MEIQTLWPGDLVRNRYRILAPLGYGPAGAVYRAFDEHQGFDVALKLYVNPDSGVQRLMRQEGSRLKQLSHPQIPKVFTSFSDGDNHYLISEYVDGVDLRTLLRQHGPLPADKAADWLAAIIDPLDYLHSQQEPHLDLKPANIRVGIDGVVYLVDTGLPGLGIAPGSTGFASPEQEKQTAVDPRSDIYGLGATLFALLTAKRPPSAVGRETGHAEYIPAMDLNPAVPGYLSALASRAMSLNPDLRPKSTAEFRKALHRPAGRSLDTATLAIDRQPLTSYGTSPKSQSGIHRKPAVRRRQIQRRTIYGLSFLLVMLVATIFGLSLLRNEPELIGGSEEAATATVQSQIVTVLTEVAPSPTPTLTPTPGPTPTPPPLIVKTGMRMVYVPGGTFRFGNDNGLGDESPAQMITINPFFIDETEVTNAQYAECVADGVCSTPAQFSDELNAAFYGLSAFDDHPVAYVNWFQAETFCGWREARLPSEAEWERAAGFDPVTLQRTLYPWGDEFNNEVLNFCDANCTRDIRDTEINDEFMHTAPVGSFPDGASKVGALDMMGNVMEWTSDWYDSDYYEVAPRVNPSGPPDGEFKSLRGGSWFSPAEEIGNTVRGNYDPTVARATLGFRCASDLP